MNEPDQSQESAAMRLSALLDGELHPASVAETCREWRSDPQLRSDWHAYALIGDVMRSADLAQGASGDTAFLEAVRARLAQEPAHSPVQEVGPAPAPAREIRSVVRRRHRWATPLGIAAGVAMVSGLAWTLRPAPDDTLTAVATAGSPQVLHAVHDKAVVLPVAQEASSPVNPYLSAHRRAVSSNVAFGLAPAFMHSVARDSGQ